MLNADALKFQKQAWYNPLQYRYTSKANMLPDELYTQLLASKERFYKEPLKKIMPDGTITYNDREEGMDTSEYYTEYNALRMSEFDHKTPIDYSSHTTNYPEWEQALDLIKIEMESYLNKEVSFRRWACIIDPPTVPFHYDFFTHAIYDNNLTDEIDLSKYFISFLILSDTTTDPDIFKAGKTVNCPQAPDNIGFSTEVKPNQWFMHSQNLGHQYLKNHQSSSYDFFSTCWMIKD